MNFIATSIADVTIIEPAVFSDDRGFFLETWNKRTFAEAGFDLDFVQDNHSQSAKGVLRGLHYQLANPQGKLVRVISGRAYDAVVDIRRNSPTFGHFVGVELSEHNKRMLWVPPGFAHGFLSLEDGTNFVYKCTDYYAPQDERSVLWSDPAIKIDWPLQQVGAPIVSAKDRDAPLLVDAELPL